MPEPKRMAKALLAWYARQGRSLPWRDSRDPYRIWISEIMLQQTQAKRGAEYFTRWIGRFPDIASVAEAGEEEILSMWEGLGYYSRAVNAHKAARVVTRDLDGEFPRTREGLESLPGVGAYTAGAILSMAFGLDEPAVDANAVRVITRLFDVDAPPAGSSGKARIEALARDMIPPGKAAEINQALMDLGSLICRPKSPRCESCPLNEDCQARFLGVVADRPLRPAAMKTTPVLMVTGVLRHQGLFFVQKRPAQGVWASLWEFPGGRIENGETPEAGIIREYAEETGFSVEVADGLGVIRHAYTRYRVTMHAFSLRLRQAPAAPRLTAATEYSWAGPEELERLPMPSAQRKLMLRLRENGVIPGGQ